MKREIKDIKCNAINCVYNSDASKCTAGHIVVGNSSACNCDQTQCSTFELDIGADNR